MNFKDRLKEALMVTEAINKTKVKIGMKIGQTVEDYADEKGKVVAISDNYKDLKKWDESGIGEEGVKELEQEGMKVGVDFTNVAATFPDGSSAVYQVTKGSKYLGEKKNG